MGKHTRGEFLPDSPSAIAQVSPARPNPQLSGYRAAVADLVQEASRCLGPADLVTAERLIAGRLGQQEFASVLARLDGGVDAAATRLMREIRNYRPSVRSSASDLPTFVRILLLSQIDSVWWSGTAPFVSDTDVLRSTELVDLTPLRSAKTLQFQYHAQSAGWPGRARDWARRQALPRMRPHTAGLRFTRSRPEVVAVVNQIARELAAALPPRTPRLWVTSMVGLGRQLGSDSDTEVRPGRRPPLERCRRAAAAKSAELTGGLW